MVLQVAVQKEKICRLILITNYFELSFYIVKNAKCNENDGKQN